MKIIVFSANFGDYDNFYEPKIIDKNVRYILFTDNKYYNSKIWEISHSDFIDSSLSLRKKARFIKLNPHLILPEHDVSIWVDFCFKPKFDNAEKLLNDISFGDKNIMCYKHSERICTYDESSIIKSRKLDDISVVENQMKKYKNEGFPEKCGLFETGFLVRKNNEETKKLNDFWWGEVIKHSGRDQLSQMYSSWKTGVKIESITTDKSVYKNRYLDPKIPHLKK